MTKSHTRPDTKPFSIRLLNDDEEECEYVWALIARNISNDMMMGITLKGMRQPLVNAGTVILFGALHQVLGSVAMSGAIAITIELCVCFWNAYFGLYWRLFGKSCPDWGSNMFAYYNSGASPGCFWVAECDGKIIGSVGIKGKAQTGESTAMLKRMAVEKPYRRQGVASALMKTAIEFCKEQGYHEIVLDTSEVQPNAMKFYLRHGFIEIGREAVSTVFPLFTYHLHQFKGRVGLLCDSK